MPKTTFRPETHGFAFVNSWEHDPQLQLEVRGRFGEAIKSTRALLSHLPGGALLWMALGEIRATLTTWVNEALVEPYGLCGGMAFAALDYYLVDKELPRGDQSGIPGQDTPEGQQLRDYISKRLVDSLALNGPTFLAWMAVLHRISDWGPFRGGPGWLLGESQKQFRTLKRDVDAGRPRPIGLIGTAHDPTLNHQVLAYGYEDPGDGTGAIYVYDMNCPGQERVISLDFREQHLAAEEDCGSSNRGPLRGFFCETYVREPFPPTIVWP